jgi:hypothetical protein
MLKETPRHPARSETARLPPAVDPAALICRQKASSLGDRMGATQKGISGEPAVTAGSVRFLFRTHVADVWFSRAIDREHGRLHAGFDRAWRRTPFDKRKPASQGGPGLTC